MGTHSGRGLEKILVGSVAEKVLHHMSKDPESSNCGWSNDLKNKQNENYTHICLDA